MLSWAGAYVGRRQILLVGHGVFTLFVFAQIFAPSPQHFAIFTCLACFGIGGATISAILLIMEVIGPSIRTAYGSALWMHWGLAYFLIEAKFLIFGSWVHVWIVIAVLAALSSLILPTIDESPRFLAGGLGKFHVAR
jgi:MFS family permease